MLPAAFTFSQSSLQDFVDCPRRFQLRYIEQLAWPTVETEPVLENERRQQEGQFFHRLVQQHWLGLPDEKLARLASTPNLDRWWKNFSRYDFGLDGYTNNIEFTLTAPIGTRRLLAKFDLVASKPGEKALIFDWKTSQKRPRDEWMAARLQTRIYRFMLVHAGAHLNDGKPLFPEQVEMAYWYADFPAQPARFPYSAEQFNRDQDFLAGLVNEISRHALFPLTEDEKKCAFCPYRSYCNRGIAAGSCDEADDSDLSSFDINFEQIAEIEY